jgi:hypothetical protein
MPLTGWHLRRLDMAFGRQVGGFRDWRFRPKLSHLTIMYAHKPLVLFVVGTTPFHWVHAFQATESCLAAKKVCFEKRLSRNRSQTRHASFGSPQ